MDEFTLAYIECALWSSTDDAGEPLDSNYDSGDIALETIETIQADCAHFQETNAADIAGREDEAGHDFWLTRNGHGAGFWDGDWPEAGDRLTEACKAFGAYDLYVGDDGKLHGCH